MRKCKEEFKEFERQDVKYREDFKHVNQKIKKLEDKVEKVEGSHSLWQLKVKVCVNETSYPFVYTFYIMIHKKLNLTSHH